MIRGRASEELFTFSKALSIPVANTFMSKGVVPWDSELSLLAIGLQAHDYVNCGFDQADLVIAVGYDFVEYAPRFWNPNQDKKIIHIDMTPSEVDAAYQASVEVIADIRETLEQLRLLVNKPKRLDYHKKLRQYIIEDLERHAKEDSKPVKPQRVLHELRKQLGDNGLLISDVGAHKLWIARMFLTRRPNTVLISNGLASMGIALPGAIAAKLLYPQRPVIAVCGDGGFLMNAHELETAVRLKINPVTVVFNDGCYGLIHWKQMKQYGRAFGVNFGNPDLVMFAKSFGAQGYRVESGSDFAKALKEALKQPVPSVIDVPIDPAEHGRLMEAMGNLVCPL